jgi:uncharacterized MAPEG superfamily protein|tara:strand:- start:79 stop:462 length:384 start_codon:yes stop_codon:yes gene_type:complete
MINLIICVLFFYAAHLFLKMSFSLHKVPFINFTVANGDLSGMTDLSERMGLAGENLRQSLFIFIPFAVMSAVLGVDNLMLAKTWFGLRIVYFLGHLLNLYKIPYIRPIIWVPSIVVLIMMGLNLYVS